MIVAILVERDPGDCDSLIQYHCDGFVRTHLVTRRVGVTV